MRTSLVPVNLDEKIGLHISSLCPHSLGKEDAQNHCAHFVSHIMNYSVGTATCKNYTFADKQLDTEGATIRVDDIFNTSSIKGLWSSKPKALTECLVFVTLDKNISPFGSSIKMGSMSKKHIGIFTNGHVYHYGNTKNEIACDSPDAFIRKFTGAYGKGGNSVSFYYGRFL